MYRHILIPTDGSELAQHAVSHGLALAKAVGAKASALVAEHSFNFFNVPESKIYSMPKEFAAYNEQVKTHAAKILDGVAQAAKSAGVAARLYSSCRISPTKASSRPPTKKAATSSSWRRTAEAHIRTRAW